MPFWDLDSDGGSYGDDDLSQADSLPSAPDDDDYDDPDDPDGAMLGAADLDILEHSAPAGTSDWKGGQAEIDAWERVSKRDDDPWIRSIRNLGERFDEYRLDPELLGDVLSSLQSNLRLLGTKDGRALSPLYAQVADLPSMKASRLNPWALSFAHLIYNPRYPHNIDPEKFKQVEIAIMPELGRSAGDVRTCQTDADCPLDPFRSCERTGVGGLCRFSKVDIPSVLRYVKVWERIYKT